MYTFIHLLIYLNLRALCHNLQLHHFSTYYSRYLIPCRGPGDNKKRIQMDLNEGG
jgi:hypothetical protein